MNVNYNDINFMESETYKNYANNNKGQGILNIRAYAANSAIPIQNLKVIVSKNIDNLKVIFFEGVTNNSGVINQIKLPTPIIELNNEEVPPSQDYDITATYNNENLIYKIKMFNNIQVLQNINVVPSIRLEGSIYGD